MMVAYFGVGSIHILAHNSTMPTALRWIATATMMAMMVGWMFILHRLVGRSASLPAPNWTFVRLFTYGRLTPSRAGRLAMWQKMCEEGGVTPAHGLATDPEDPSQALIVGPTIISNDASQHAMHTAV